MEGADWGWRHGDGYEMSIDTLRRLVGAFMRAEVSKHTLWSGEVWEVDWSYWQKPVVWWYHKGCREVRTGELMKWTAVFLFERRCGWTQTPGGTQASPGSLIGFRVLCEGSRPSRSPCGGSRRRTGGSGCEIEK